MKVKLTKRTIDAARPAERDVLLWDTELPGFGCKITPKGGRVLLLQYSSRGRARRVTLGRHGIDLTVDEARKEALRLRGEVAGGGDPAADRAHLRAMPSLAELAKRYLESHAAVKKKASSYAADERNLRNHILPALGTLRVDAVSRADIARFHADMHATPGAANRCLALLSKLFNLAELWGFRPDGTNPARRVEKYRERKFERFLSDAELGRLGATLADAEREVSTPATLAAIRVTSGTGCRPDRVLSLRWDQVDFERACLRFPEGVTVPLDTDALDALRSLPRGEAGAYVFPGARPGSHLVGVERAWGRLTAIAAVRLLIFTGCRRDEVLTLQWDHVDFDRACLRLPDSKAGAKTVPLGAPAVELLAGLPRVRGNPYVLPGSVPGRHFVGIEKAWQRFRTAAQLPDVRLHDLRHSFASVGAGMGESLLLIGALLGHREQATTARYAHLSNDPVRAAADRIGDHLASALAAGRGDGAKVVNIVDGRRKLREPERQSGE